MKLVVLTASKRFPDDADTSMPISAATQLAHKALEADGWELRREVLQLDEPGSDEIVDGARVPSDPDEQAWLEPAASSSFTGNEPIVDPQLGRAPTDETTAPLLRRLQDPQRRGVGNAENFFVLRQMPAPSFTLQKDGGDGLRGEGQCKTRDRTN